MYLMIQFNHCAQKAANFGTGANVPLDPQHYYFEIVIRSKIIVSILSKLLINILGVFLKLTH
jgi:hypothetical protein